MSEAGSSWYGRPAEEVAAELRVEPERGLSGEEAVDRLRSTGPNLLPEGRRLHWPRLLLRQFTDFMILVLIAAAVLAGLTGDMEDVVVILAIVTLNGAVGFIQEARAERAIQALRRLAAPHALVRRDGRVIRIRGEDLVPGDVVLLEAGAVVPGDLRLLEEADLAIQEAALTGESVAVSKDVAALAAPQTPVAEQRNMAFKGTVVARGRGVGLCVATGARTELGRIAELLAESEETLTPLQKRLRRFGRRLSWLVLGICVLVFAAGLLRGEPLMLMLLTAVSLAVAAIPEALPAVVTISLAIGARRMAARQALVRRLPAVETLGSVTYICSDKTGTLTENRMSVRGWWVEGEAFDGERGDRAGDWATIADLLAVSNDVAKGPEGWLGDPTEVALVEAAVGLGIDPEQARRRLPRVGEFPFESELQRMVTIHQADGGQRLVFAKGSPEAMLALCELDEAGRTTVREAADREAAKGRRLLALAWRRLERPDLGRAEVERGLTLLALVALEDPPREEVAEAVAACHSAGIRAVMLTGDHPATARSIAVETGLLPPDGRVLTGPELDTLDDAALEALFTEPVAFARVAPEHKIRIVRALKSRGEFVAMTGDGVNDAPALKQADIGVAMGESGTDVAREASDMVLLDDNFATIVNAVREGRRMYDNVRRFIRYAMTGNSAEILAILLAPFLGLPLPLLPIHILWVNLVTDGLPGLALAVEPADEAVMRRPPRPPAESLFAGGLWQHSLGVGALIAALTLLGLAWSLSMGSESWQTLAFTTLVFAQLANVLSVRSETRSLWSLGIGSNRPLLWIVLASVGVQLALIYTPMGQRWFNVQALPPLELAWALGTALVVFGVVELGKWRRARRGKSV
ncbi:MAG: cation-translocating P-type ATPase [Steroidobacteraceae bacterium]